MLLRGGIQGLGDLLQLTVLVAFPEGLNSIPSTHIRHLMPSSGFHEHHKNKKKGGGHT